MCLGRLWEGGGGGGGVGVGGGGGGEWEDACICVCIYITAKTKLCDYLISKFYECSAAKEFMQWELILE